MNPYQRIPRDEAFQIYLALIRVSEGRNIGSLAEFSIQLAKGFHEEFAKLEPSPDPVTLPTHKPLSSVGRFYTNGNSLCIEAGDGSHCFKSEFADPQHALDWAIALNQLFRVEA